MDFVEDEWNAAREDSTCLEVQARLLKEDEKSLENLIEILSRLSFRRVDRIARKMLQIPRVHPTPSHLTVVRSPAPRYLASIYPRNTPSYDTGIVPGIAALPA
uniref:Uncharacterized protein n=1 Tax=Vespula pensylvanica TaxID=30213 RepID=A0A834NQB5_VESPE|nr:hypothetical protein H0235_012086 [Vespula pensylvanica]